VAGETPAVSATASGSSTPFRLTESRAASMRLWWVARVLRVAGTVGTDRKTTGYRRRVQLLF
jgi:hypothetical protein